MMYRVIAATIVVASLTTAAQAIECKDKMPAGGAGHWSWRNVDGKQCWYQGPKGMDKAKLTWRRAAPPAPAAVDIDTTVETDTTIEPGATVETDEEKVLLESYWPNLDELLATHGDKRANRVGRSTRSVAPMVHGGEYRPCISLLAPDPIAWLAVRPARSRMQFRQLGPFQVSLVGLGCNNFGGRISMEASRAVIEHALDAGITLFDTADSYGNEGGSEKALGAFLGPRRKNIVLATKFGLGGGGSRRHVMAACEASLKRLNTDWIDFYQLHRPDPRTPIEETLRALDDLVHQGKVRAIGCSNLSAAQVDEALATSQRAKLASFVSCQDEYNLLAREIETELVPAIERHGLMLLPYFPLASGMLTGKYRRGEKPPPGSRLARISNHADRYLNDANFVIVEKLEAFATARGHSLLDLAFSWLAARPYVASVIAGATKPEQVDANIKAADWALSTGEMAEIDRLSAPA